MNLTALMLLGLAGVGQPADADIVPFNSRTLTLDINYDSAQRKEIEKSYLFVSRDQGQTWSPEVVALPTQEAFQYTVPEDGVYWVNVMTVFRNGRKDPPDISRVPPARKLLIDSTPPAVRITNARWDGDELLVAWEIQDKYPNDAATRVLVKPTGAGESSWQPAPSEAVMRRTAKFNPALTGPVTVKVVAIDLAGNVGEMARELGTPAGPTTTTTAYLPATASPVLPPPSLPPESSGPVAPPHMPLEPAFAHPAVSPSVVAPVQPDPVPTAMAPQPTPAPVPNPSPVYGGANWMPAASSAEPPPAPIAVGAGTAQAVPDAGAVQAINFTRFDLQYQVENGPSGVSRVDLYVTRDDGRTWYPWSKHAGGEAPLRVVLDTGFNQQVEGNYGFRLVPVSGAGLADGAPTPGTPPDLRVHVDTTPPVIKVYQPIADPDHRNALVLKWEAFDRNFGPDPIAIEWSEQPIGPWQPVTGGAGHVVAGLGGGAMRVANTGAYSWQLPAGLGTHKVYLKFTAWDTAGNRSEVVTPSPVLVDLTKPRAKIQGILGGPAVR